MPDYRLGNPEYKDSKENIIGSVYVSRARKPEDLVVIKCWEDIVNNFLIKIQVFGYIHMLIMLEFV